VGGRERRRERESELDFQLRRCFIMLWLLGNHWHRSGTEGGECGCNSTATWYKKKLILSKKMKGNPGSGLSEANQVENCNHINAGTVT
jgi:hypothetical protein